MYDEYEPVYVPDKEDKVEDGRRYCYVNVDVPEDFSGEYVDDRFDVAVNEAREMFPDYVSPCYWELVSDIGGTVRVRRVSRA